MGGMGGGMMGGMGGGMMGGMGGMGGGMGGMGGGMMGGMGGMGGGMFNLPNGLLPKVPQGGFNAFSVTDDLSASDKTATAGPRPARVLLPRLTIGRPRSTSALRKARSRKSFGTSISRPTIRNRPPSETPSAG